MALKTKEIKIGEFNINIIQFSAIESLRLRKELVENVKKQIGDVSLDDTANLLKSIAGLIYEIPSELFLKLFKNCSAVGLGGLNSEDTFNKVFENNLDGTIELVLEILEFNGFFSLGILSTLGEKIPALAPVQASIQREWNKETPLADMVKA
tara:strand:+ start:584 stop:1039 length:456 start_codon:yes stop_codon:yes gene_type:complete